MFRTIRRFRFLILVVGFAVAAEAQTLEEGIGLYAAGQYEQARPLLAAIVLSDPANTVASGYLGLTLVELGQFGDAERYLNAASGSEPPLDRIHVGLARVYLSRRQNPSALEALAEAEGINPDNADIFYNRGIALLMTNEFAPAAEQLERSLRLDPANAHAHYYAGLAYNGLRRSDRVVEHFQTFLRMAPDAPEAERVRSLMRALR